jgi:maleylpyruvate isomerase
VDDAASRALDAQVAGCAAAHQRLLVALESITDDQCRKPSLLAGWTRGHLLSHLARNAESHARLFAAATRGEESEQYVGGSATRVSEIETGANGSAKELVSDVRATIYALEAAWASATSTTWSGFGIKSHSDGSRVSISDLVLLRWCEVEVHHADLDIGYTWRDWDPLYVRYDLDRRVMAWKARKPMGLTTLPDAVQQVSPNERLAWLYNRTTIDGVPSVEPY